MPVELRKLPRSSEMLSTLGFGTSYVHFLSQKEIYDLLTYAFDHGVNLVDYLSHRTGAVEGMSPAIRDRRKDIFLQMHFGVHFPNDQYTKNRNADDTKRTIEADLKMLNTDYIDAAFLANVDTFEDLDAIMAPGGIWDYMDELKKDGAIRHYGFSSHDVNMCNHLLDMGFFDLFMFSENAAADFTPENGKLIFNQERMKLFQRCQRESVGITCMKTFLGGKLLDEKMSPFGVKLTPYQCMKYNLNRPGVMSCIAGITNIEELKNLLEYYELPDEEKDYSIIAGFQMENVTDSCIYCNHCQPCPGGIDIAAVNKYKDLAEIGDDMAIDHYRTLSAHTEDCIGCRQCEARCPFHISPYKKIQQAKTYFGY